MLIPEALSDVIAINIVTYNRAPYLDRTLGLLMAGPFKHARVSILDNCSTDATAEICVRYQAAHKNIRVIRHNRNIGAVGNVLRAMELSSCKFTWVLCDDDILDFSDCGDLIDALLADEPDLVIVGAPGKLPFDWGLKVKFRTQFESNPSLFHVLSFVPSMIFRSSLVDGIVLQQAYLIGGDMFPHLALAGSLLRSDANIYMVRHPLVRQDYADPYWWTQLEIIAHWVRTCQRVIPSSDDRRKVIYEMVCSRNHDFGPGIFFRQMLKMVALEKAQGTLIKAGGGAFRRSAGEYFIEIFSGCTWEQRLLMTLCFPLLMVPSWFYVLLRKFYRWFKYTLLGRPQPAMIPPQSMFDREPVKNLPDPKR